MNDSKEHILKTSLILFLQKSYRDVTMKEIVEQSGLSKGAVYHYFKNKESLFNEIVTLFISIGTVDYASFSQISLKSFYRQYVDYLDNAMFSISQQLTGSNDKSFNFNFFLIMFEAVSRFPDFLHMELEIHKKDMLAWEKIIGIARAGGEITSNSSNEEIANLFLFCTDGVFLRFVNNDKPRSFRDFLMNTFDTIYKNISG